MELRGIGLGISDADKEKDLALEDLFHAVNLPDFKRVVQQVAQRFKK